MKTLIVLAPHPDLAEAIRASLNQEQYRIVHRTRVEEAEPMLVHGLAQACILDIELSGVESVWIIEKLRRQAPNCPLLVYTGVKQSEWEEEAYLRGVAHVLTKPVRPRLLAVLLERLWTTTSSLPAITVPELASSSSLVVAAPQQRVGDTTFISGPSQTLSVLRSFSGILSHSLDSEGLLKQFLLLLRD